MSEPAALPPEVTLLACVPHGRLEIGPQSVGGRGGLTLHQATADRLVSHLNGCPLRAFVQVAVTARPAVEGDALEAVRLTCRTGRRVVAVAELTEPGGGSCTHRYRDRHDPLTIYNFAAELEIGPRYAGLVAIEVELKLASRPDFLPAAGRGWCHVTDEPLGNRVPLPDWRYRLLRPFLAASAGRPNRLYRLLRRVRGR